MLHIVIVIEWVPDEYKSEYSYNDIFVTIALEMDSIVDGWFN